MSEITKERPLTQANTSVIPLDENDSSNQVGEGQIEKEERFQFETLLADLSARFVNLPAEQVDRQIEDAQRRICECLELDHSSLWQASPNEPQMLLLSHLYRDANLPPAPDRMDADSYFPWAQSKLKNRETVCVPSTANVPREAAVDQKTWGVFGIKSTLGFPLSVGDGPVFGVLSFDATEKEREWPPALVNRLQLLGQVFANTLARKRTEQALSESEERLRMAAASANAGLWTLNPTTGQIWSTEKTKELFGVPPTEELDVKKLLNLVHPDDREAVDCVIENAIESGEDTSVEYRIIRPDGQIRWISACGRLHSGGFREPGQLMGVSVDITERRLAQEELQRSYSEIKELKERIQTESDYLQEEIKHIGRYDEIVGQSKTLKYVLKKVEQVAHTDSVVLITGETGTGKELIARAIHNLSKQKDRVMVKVDCAALPPTLIESELFGREKGAYTGAVSRQIGRFETANGSTLFLDEIGELGVEVQAKLMRIVQDGEFERLGTTRTTQVNVRLIAATHRDLAELVKNGTFREDLFYRLNVFPILVPPLRERQEDIPLLVSAFIREFEKKMGKKISTVASKTMDELKRYPWPGNIRELRNIIERAVIVTTGERLNLQMPKTLNGASTRTLQETEVQHILTTLEKTGWRIKGPNGAALILGIKPSTLYTMMHRLRIPTRHEKGGIQS